MIKRIAHVGIAVQNIEEFIASLSKALDLPLPSVKDVPEKQMKVAVIDIGGPSLEIVQEDREDGSFAQLARERGNAIHHFCLLTDDIDADVELLKERGVDMADPKPRMGVRGKRVAFARPTTLKGVIFELSEP